MAERPLSKREVVGSNPTGGLSRWQPLRESFAELGLVGLGWAGLSCESTGANIDGFPGRECVMYSNSDVYIAVTIGDVRSQASYRIATAAQVVPKRAAKPDE